MTEIIVAVIGLAGLVLTQMVKAHYDNKRVLHQATQARSEASQAKEQVKNSHQENLRDNVDRNHEEVMSRFDRVDRRVAALTESDRAQWQAIEHQEKKSHNG